MVLAAVTRRFGVYGPWLLVLSALLSFGAGYLVSYYEQLPDGHSLPGTVRVQSLVQQAIGTAHREADRLLAVSQQSSRLDFDKVLSQSTYPAFIFEYGQLRGWSAAGPLPTPLDVADPRPERLAQTSLGDFVVVRQAAGAGVVLVYVPLTQHYGISNRYLRSGDGLALLQGLDVEIRAAARPTAPRTTTIRSAAGQSLFAVQWLQNSSPTGHYLPLLLLALGVLLYVAGWLVLARRLWQAGRGGAAVAALVLPLAALRLALMQIGLPYALLELPLFDPRIYAVSDWTPSLGDLLLNAILALVVAVGVLLLSAHYRWQTRIQRGNQVGWGLGLTFTFGLLLLGLHSYYHIAFSGSQLNLDITQSIQVSGFRLVLALAIVLHTAAFLLTLLLITRLLGPSRQLVHNRLLAVGTAGIAAVLLGVSALLGGWHWLGLASLTVSYLALVQAAGPRRLGLPYLLLLLLGLGAATGAMALYEQFGRQLLLDKQRLATNLLVDNDLQGEFLLGERIKQLAADPVIAQLLSSQPARAEAVRRRVNRQYLRDYFDKYEAGISLFDAEGRPVGTDAGDTLTFGQTREVLSRTATATDQAGVFLLKSENSFSSRRYAAVVPLVTPPSIGIGPPAPAGTIVLTLSLKKLSSYSVLPELLVDQKFFQPGLATDLSYAGYADGRLVYSEGDFDYANLLPPPRLRDPRLYREGLVLSDFHHLAVRGPEGRTVVVTTTTYSLANWLSNFSFQLLLNSLLWLLGAGVWLLLRRDSRTVQFNFSARIQILLNVGILLSLLVVSVATASQVIASYRRDLLRTYERRGRIALESLLRRRDLLADTTARPALASLVRNVASLTETDLNLYDAQGQLLVSSQPLIFEAGLLGPLLNPQAVVELRERGLNRTLLTEHAGSLSFSALYLPVHLPSSASGAAAGALLGYVGIPFFDSQKELDSKLTELFTTILNIFTLMFLLFMGLSFVATRQLTAPLKLLTNRLTRTTLTGENEVLDYRSSDDEIGLLVREYNTMLGKLEASKRELAAQEKEAAWREMARQVAHEIKNPLTPMKLSLQYLQKAIDERRPNAEQLISRISQTLITQIDVLSDIATSFSTFTNLPAMRPVRLDLAPLLRHCVDLLQVEEGGRDAEVALRLPPDADAGRYLVFADESLLVRTFNNLLINARQALVPGRPPHIEVALVGEGPAVRIAIEDNGAGISEEVRAKMFVPNFTTKATGSGIGLAVAKRGIESAGGRIWFETQEGVGTTFFIELPLAG